MVRKLKVFQAQIGFFDTVVAAPSQAAALRAWGVRQNLFADGVARVTTDAQAVKAALAHPETPLRRAAGSRDDFALEPPNLPKIPGAPKKAATRKKARAKPEPPPRPGPDRADLDAAEAVVRALDERRKREEADLRRQRDELDRKTEAVQSAYVEARKAASAAVVTARGAYRKTGGWPESEEVE